MSVKVSKQEDLEQKLTQLEKALALSMHPSHPSASFAVNELYGR
jgi:hypothetical protein